MLTTIYKKVFEKKCGYDTATIRFLYMTGLLLIIPIAACLIFLHTDIAKDLLLRHGVQCSFLKVTGLPCPSCGGTRATFLLAYLRIIESIKFNAAIFTGALFYIVFMAVETLHFKLSVRGFSEAGFFAMFYTWLGVLIIQWLYKITPYIL